MEEVVQGVALALVDAVKPLVYVRAGLTGHSGGVIGAVVRHHIEVQELGRVILLAHTLQKLGDDAGLIAGGHHYGKAVQAAGLVLVLPAAADQSHHYIDALVEIEQCKQDGHQKIQKFNKV